MALSRPRKLTVADELYHWKASKHGVLHFAVRKPGTPKMRMVVNFRKAAVTITPGLVCSYIRRALAEGWTGSVSYEHEVDRRE
jgi:hypothetical protein